MSDETRERPGLDCAKPAEMEKVMDLWVKIERSLRRGSLIHFLWVFT